MTDQAPLTQAPSYGPGDAPEGVTAGPPNGQRSGDEVSAEAATFPELFQRITANVAKVIQGKQEVIEMTLLCLVSEGHLLIEDVPGVGKTSLAKALASSLDCSFGRVQFTPDVLPTDVVGVNVWNRASGQFEFRPGPIFHHLVLGDEINRASPKTQAALLEAMEERQVTVDGTTYRLQPPFMVLATQNPVEHEGTYPLPESQLDRFLMRVSVGYPAPDAAIEILDTHGSDSAGASTLEPVATAEDVAGMIATIKSVHVAPSLKRYIVELADASRRHPALTLGISPRATLNLQRAGRALAAAKGREYVVPDDLKVLARSVLGHRLMLTPETQLQGATVDDVLDDILATVPIPVSQDA
jgi:MoxR-like ATPase